MFGNEAYMPFNNEINHPKMPIFDRNGVVHSMRRSG